MHPTAAAIPSRPATAAERSGAGSLSLAVLDPRGADARPARARGPRCSSSPSTPVDLPGLGGWAALTTRLDDSRQLLQWAALEQNLSGQSLDGLREQLRQGVDPRRADELLGALVRLGAASGHDKPDAVLVVLHLLSDGAQALARQLGDLTSDPLALVVSELAVQVRAFPTNRPRRAVAAGLLLTTRRVLLHELRPHRTRRHPDVREVPVDPTDTLAVLTVLEPAAARAACLREEAVDDLDLLEVLLWAQHTGVVDADDIALLLHAERGRASASPFTPELLQAWGQSERTLRRRRVRTLAALQATSADYLRHCA